MSDTTTTRIYALPLEQLEALAVSLLDFLGLAVLNFWLATNTCRPQQGLPKADFEGQRRDC